MSLRLHRCQRGEEETALTEPLGRVNRDGQDHGPRAPISRLRRLPESMAASAACVGLLIVLAPLSASAQPNLCQTAPGSTVPPAPTLRVTFPHTATIPSQDSTGSPSYTYSFAVSLLIKSVSSTCKRISFCFVTPRSLGRALGTKQVIHKYLMIH